MTTTTEHLLGELGKAISLVTSDDFELAATLEEWPTAEHEAVLAALGAYLDALAGLVARKAVERGGL